MIEIRWSEKINDIGLRGTLQSLQDIRQSILRLLQTDEVQISISANVDFDPAPYSSLLSFLTIRKGIGSTKVAVATEHLEVTGNSDCLARFAEYFDFDGSEVNCHCHFDYYEGNEWIVPDSLPLVISVR